MNRFLPQHGVRKNTAIAFFCSRADFARAVFAPILISYGYGAKTLGMGRADFARAAFAPIRISYGYGAKTLGMGRADIARAAFAPIRISFGYGAKTPDLRHQ